MHLEALIATASNNKELNTEQVTSIGYAPAEVALTQFLLCKYKNKISNDKIIMQYVLY